MSNELKACQCGAAPEKAVEDLAIDLAGILIAPTFPNHKTKKQQSKWMDYWKRELEKAIKKSVKGDL